MTFGPTATLPIASAPFFVPVYIARPVVLRSVPQSFEFRSVGGGLEFKSVPQSFTFRGRR